MVLCTYGCYLHSINLNAPFINVTHQLGTRISHDLATPILCGFALLAMWYSQKGHVAYGVTDASFRESLLATLEKLQLPYEESLSTIRLTSIEVDLQVSVQAWMGTGIIKVKQRAHRSDLRKIVNAMNEYFRTSAVSTNMISCALLLVGGIIMVLLAIVVSFVWKQFPTQIG